LAELPPVHPALYDRGPPVWFRLLAFCLAELAFSEAVIDHDEAAALNVEEEWTKFQLRYRERFFARQDRCLSLLCQHYGIDIATPEAGWKLAKALAGQHVPAFRIERAVQKQRERRAKKPTELDVYGTLCLFVCDCLDAVREGRALTAEEERFREICNNEVQARGLAGRTIGSFKNQMRGAHAAYWEGCASDFQRLFIEEVEPAATDLFEKLGNSLRKGG
jgi:hypothetical protein